MKILSLKVKKNTFDAIASGKKKTFKKIINPNNARKFVQFEKGTAFVVEDKQGRSVPINYTCIRFRYEHDGESLLVKVNKIDSDFCRTDKGELIGEPLPGSDEYGWIFCEHTYYLGEIIDRT